MSIELPIRVEEKLRDLAATQGRDVRSVVEDALSQYLQAAAVTDVDEQGVAAAQMQLMAELPDISDWPAENP